MPTANTATALEAVHDPWQWRQALPEHAIPGPHQHQHHTTPHHTTHRNSQKIFKKYGPGLPKNSQKSKKITSCGTLGRSRGTLGCSWGALGGPRAKK